MGGMKELRWGTIGCGDVCERKSGLPLYKVPGCRLIGVTRRDAEKGRDFARRHGPCRYYESVEALLAEPQINAIYVATPHAWHMENTLAAAKAGKHVLVEKPMANDAGECQRMIEECRQANVILGVAYYRRCYPSMLRVKQLIAENAVGQARTLRINAEFPLSHRLDLVHFFFGDVVRLSAEPGTSGAVLHTVSTTGVEAIMNVGWKETGAPETVEVAGDAGRIVVDDLKGGSLTVERNGQSQREVFAPLPATHWGLIENFLAHFNGQAPLACDGVEGRKSTVILDIVSTLAADGRDVKVDYHNAPAYDPAQASRLGLLG
jgi:predicted dehydrogenase